MARIKIHRKSVWIDMTSMVDVCFLLLTFFMLATKFKADDAVDISTPASISELEIPENTSINILIDKNSRVFFGVTGNQFRGDLLSRIATQKNINFSNYEKSIFRVIENFGVPLNQLKEYLDLPPSQRKAMDKVATGIPVTSDNDATNELYTWILSARRVTGNAPIIIKGDKNANIEVINKVIKTLQSQKANRFSIITDLKKENN
ncbi:MAG: ExbD/TolR family protein [Solitalea-like symbiont of Tyrophagus putrescentiae]